MNHKNIYLKAPALFIAAYGFSKDDSQGLRNYNIAKLFEEVGIELELFFAEELQEKNLTIKEEFMCNSEIKKKLNLKNYKYIICDNLTIGTFLYLKKWAKKNNVILIHDSIDWCSSCQFRYKFLTKFYLKAHLINRWVIDKNFKVIAISNFLKEYYSSKNIETVVVPSIIDTKEISSTKNINFSKLTLFYAGSPLNKDYLKEIITGISLLNPLLLEKLEFRIFGVSKNQLFSECKVNRDEYEKIKKNIKVYGRIPRAEVLKNLSEADFTILLRSEKERYAKAGFPTKFTESLASATPVITNLTSDLNLYIEELQNGIIIKSCSAIEVKKTLEKVLKLSEKERTLMQRKARESAEKKLDYHQFLASIKTLL